MGVAWTTADGRRGEQERRMEKPKLCMMDTLITVQPLMQGIKVTQKV